MLVDIYAKLEPLFKDDQTLVVIGANFGDEGKGKVIDLLVRFFDYVVRFSGGANAGHTVQTDSGVKVVSHLIPCGLAQNKICVLGRGEFFDAERFLRELAEAKKLLGERLAPVYVDEGSPVWTPLHGLLESYLEFLKGKDKINTTNKGIGPLAGLWKLRMAPKVGDLFAGPTHLEHLLEPLCKMVTVLQKQMESSGVILNQPLDCASMAQDLIQKAQAVKLLVTDTSFILDAAWREGKKMLFEGAQATGLDSSWGTYPYVSSGNSTAAGAAIGSGLPLQAFNSVLMVIKTLPTRVGAGPFPSEIWERSQAQNFPLSHPELFADTPERREFLNLALQKINQGVADSALTAQYFQVLGDERGATTGRGRSVSYLDLPWLKYAIRINRPKHLALTRFDMLSGLKEIPVVTGYKLNGEILPAGRMPPAWQLAQVETVRETWPCWQEDIFGLDEFEKLPLSAQNFIQKLEQILEVPITLIGTGPQREAIIVKNKYLA